MSKPNDFLKLNCKISDFIYNANEWFDKTFVLAFYNSFLKTIILNTCSFQKKIRDLIHAVSNKRS